MIQCIKMSVLSLDPTRLTTVRRQYDAEMRARFTVLLREVVQLIAREDCFGLRSQLLIGNAQLRDELGRWTSSASITSKGRKLKRRILKKVRDTYAKLEKRYGKRIAKMAITAAIVASPIPIPGGSLLAMAPFLGAGEIKRMLARKPSATLNSEALADAKTFVDTLLILEQVANVFCPTGKGGGIDPTCSPNSLGMPQGVHTQAGQQRLIEILKKETGQNFKPHGSLVSKATSANDIDLAFVPESEEQRAKAEARGRRYEEKLHRLYAKGKITRDQLFEKLYGDPNAPDPIDVSLGKLGFSPTRLMEWGGYQVIRYHNSATKHTIELWFPGGEDGNERSIALNSRFSFQSEQSKVENFQSLFDAKAKAAILGGDKTQPKWYGKYVLTAYRKGIDRAYVDKQPLLTANAQTKDRYIGGKAQFSNQQTYTNQEAIRRLEARTYTDLEGVTKAMSVQLGRTLADGLAQGKSPAQLAIDVNKGIRGIGLNRARTIVQTELTRAHAEGQLDSLKALGADKVGFAVEWRTSGNPCPQCAALNGVVLSLQEARGLIPRHPHCKCAYAVANVGESRSGQVRSKERIRRALDKSARAGARASLRRAKISQVKKNTTWQGASVKISKKRPTENFYNQQAYDYAANVFCPTGPGGGVDPTCSPSDGFLKGKSISGVLSPRMKHYPLAGGGHEEVYRRLSGEPGLANGIVNGGYTRLNFSYGFLGVETSYANISKVRSWIKSNVDMHGVEQITFTIYGKDGIAREKTESVENVFCPIGKGGGDIALNSKHPSELTAMANWIRRQLKNG